MARCSPSLPEGGVDAAEVELGSETDRPSTRPPEPARFPVLLVEDDMAIQEMVARMLRENGWVVNATSSAEEARRLLTELSCPLLVVDKRLTGAMTGLDLVEQARANGVDFEAILMTAYADADSLTRSVRLGVFRCVVKPFALQDLLAAVLGAGTRLSLRLELRRKREELERSNAELRREVDERREAEVALRRAQEQLWQAQKQEAVGRLAGGVAHDFNNVLSVILSHAELVLADLRDDDPLRADIEEIQSAGERAARLTARLLAFSRQQVLQPRIVDLNEVLGAMDRMLARLLGGGVKLEILPCSELGTVKADPVQLEQVVLNLVVNARDAMPGGGTITLETSNVHTSSNPALLDLGLPPGPYARLAVCDTGAGMDEAVLARAFEPFFTTKPLGKGTGLGLSTVIGIVQQSGGNVCVSSELGKGTVFEVYLPCAQGEVERRASGALARRSTAGSETILLVEDEGPLRAVAGSILRREGYRVLEVPNGGEALLVCERHPDPIDLLLTDLVLPHMSGVELAERVGPMRAGMKVLLMSGYLDEAEVHQAVTEMGAQFLQKPFTPASLALKVREVLEAEAVVDATLAP